METVLRKNINRQLRDIIGQAEQLSQSSNFEVEAENFSKYNEELKIFLAASFTDPMICERVMKIPRINYKSVQPRLWHWLLLPVELVVLWKNHVAKQQCLRQVEDTKSLYSSILFLMGKEN